MAGVESVYICWPGRHNLGPGKVLSAKLSTGEATGGALTGALRQGVSINGLETCNTTNWLTINCL